MPHRVPLRAGDPRRVGRYALNGRLEGIPSDDPIFMGRGPDGAEVCVTVLAGLSDGAARDRFAAEAAVARRVAPFCAARVLDAGLDGADAFLVSEYVPGRSLLEMVAEQGVFDGLRLEALAIGTATGLASVHQAGLVHGNFGPQYVILASGGPPRVVEFGITPPYGSATPSADMLGWAQTVMFAATGQPPSESVDLDVLPEVLREPVQQCLYYGASERPAARAIVQFLLGGGSMRAGVLAEGSRRAAAAGWAGTQAETDRLDGYLTTGYRGLPPASPRTTGPLPRTTGPLPRTTGPLPGMDTRTRGAGHAARPGSYAPVRDGSVSGRHPAVQRSHAAAIRPPRRRRAAWLIGGAGAVVIVLIAVVTVVLLQSGKNPNTLAASTGSSAPSGSPRPTPTSPRVSPGAVAPAAFNGIWSGLVSSTGPSPTTFTMTVTFTTSKPTGSLHFTAPGGVNCSGTLVLSSESQRQMTMTIVTSQKRCSNGVPVTVTLAAPNSNSMNFSLAGSPPTKGTLLRQQ